MAEPKLDGVDFYYHCPSSESSGNTVQNELDKKSIVCRAEELGATVIKLASNPGVNTNIVEGPNTFHLNAHPCSPETIDLLLRVNARQQNWPLAPPHTIDSPIYEPKLPKTIFKLNVSSVGTIIAAAMTPKPDNPVNDIPFFGIGRSLELPPNSEDFLSEYGIDPYNRQLPPRIIEIAKAIGQTLGPQLALVLGVEFGILHNFNNPYITNISTRIDPTTYEKCWPIEVGERIPAAYRMSVKALQDVAYRV